MLDRRRLPWERSCPRPWARHQQCQWLAGRELESEHRYRSELAPWQRLLAEHRAEAQGMQRSVRLLVYLLLVREPAGDFRVH